MWYLIPTLFESLFPKYKAIKYPIGTCWAIGKRRYIFFYRKLSQKKKVYYEGNCLPAWSNEYLLWDSKESAEEEIDRLGFGYPEIQSEVWRSGKLTATIYKNGEVYEYD